MTSGSARAMSNRSGSSPGISPGIPGLSGLYIICIASYILSLSRYCVCDETRDPVPFAELPVLSGAAGMFYFTIV